MIDIRQRLKKALMGIKKEMIAAGAVCKSELRHRLQYWCLQELFTTHDFSQIRLLHFAQEAQLRRLLEPRIRQYETADLYTDGVDYQVDSRDDGEI